VAKKLTIGDLDELRKKLQTQRTTLEGKTRATVTVHMGTCGIAAGARKVMNALMQAVEEKTLTDVRVATAGCAGLCSREPIATVQIGDASPVRYADLTAEKIIRVLDEHVLKGNIVTEYALAMGSERLG